MSMARLMVLLICRSFCLRSSGTLLLQSSRPVVMMICSCGTDASCSCPSYALYLFHILDLHILHSFIYSTLNTFYFMWEGQIMLPLPSQKFQLYGWTASALRADDDSGQFRAVPSIMGLFPLEPERNRTGPLSCNWLFTTSRVLR